MNVQFIQAATRLLGGLMAVFFTTYIVLSIWNPTTSSPSEVTLRYQSSAEPLSIDKGAAKLGAKLNCAKKTYTLREKTWTWSCMNKSKTMGYSLVHPAFAFDLLTNDKCAVKDQVWFNHANNGWAIAAKSHNGTATRALAESVRDQVGGFTAYVCR